MRQHKALAAKPTMEEVRKKFDEWRRTKEYASSPIPTSLWDAAVELAQAHSLYEISKSLRLDHNQLKRRVQDHGSPGQSPAVCAPQFVELKVAAMSSDCTIEGERADGARMRLSVKGAMDPHLVEIAKAFWRGA